MRSPNQHHFLLIALLCVFFGNTSHADKECHSRLKRFSNLIVEVVPDVEPGKYRIDHLLSEVGHFIRPKQKALVWLWKKEAKLGYKLMHANHDFSDALVVGPILGSKPRLPMPYIFTFPRDLFNGIANIARAKGLSFPRRFILAPVKLVLTSLIRYPLHHLGFASALGWFGFFHTPLIEDPLDEQTSIEDLLENEVILLVKLDSGEVRAADGNRSSVTMAKQIDTLKARNPDKYIVLDLSKSAGTTKRNASAKIGRMIETEVKRRGLQIKEIYLAAHGSSGSVHWDVVDYGTTLGMLGTFLSPLKNHMSGDGRGEIHSPACCLAANEEGIKEVKKLAKYVLPKAGTIKVNILPSITHGMKYRGALRMEETPPIPYLGSLTFPALFEPIALSAHVVNQRTWRRAAEDGYQQSYGKEPPADWKYRYTVE